MKVTVSTLTLAAALMFAVGGVSGLAAEQAPAAGDETRADKTQTQQVLLDERHGILMRTTELANFEVRDDAGKRIGDIAELAIDTRHGIIAYVILRLDETAERDDPLHERARVAIGLGRDRYAVPWQGFRPVVGDKALALIIDHEQLTRAQVFEDQWEHLNDPQRAGELHEVFGFTPYWRGEDEPALHVIPFRDLRGDKISNAHNVSMGQIHDLMIDSRKGHAAYAVLRFGGFLGVGRDYAAVPFTTLEHAVDEDGFILDAERQTLRSMAFAGGDWPDMADENWARLVHTLFAQDLYWRVHGYAPPRQMMSEQVQDTEQPQPGHDAQNAPDMR